MSFLRYGAELDLLIVTKGHPFERDPFFAMFDGWRGVAATAVEHPAAEIFLNPEHAARYDAILFYDMPGIEFRADGPPHFHAPPEETVRGFEALLAAGKGLVFLHHAIAGWPAWPAYADAIGARFLYAPATVRGREWPDSGYRHEIRHRVTPQQADHPVLEGLDAGFEIEDELYLCPVFEGDVLPLLRSDFKFHDASFYSSALAIRGQMFSREGWRHPAGSNLVAWAKRAGRSPVVTITGGDSPNAYGNEGFRRLLENAVRWVASDDARGWARRPG